MESISVQHPPAVKVGGRRLSISAKHKTHSTTVTSEPAPVKAGLGPENDYPRPTAPGDGQIHHHNPPHTEEEVPSKEKHWNHESELKLRDMAHRKTESTRPSKDMIGVNKGYGAGGRIAQPAGKGFNL